MTVSGKHLDKYLSRYMLFLLLVSGLFLIDAGTARGQEQESEVRITEIGEGWAKNSINTVIFRKNSVITHDSTQYAAYYDAEGTVILAKRKLEKANWTAKKTRFQADVTDAHNSISFALDGNGIIHLSWGMHGGKLQYARSKYSDSLLFASKQTMTGMHEEAVTYPRFYRLPGGDLLFLYRHGQSGSGDIMLNRYDITTGKWHQISHPLISGAGERNAYMNGLAVDSDGQWHVSWTWRDTWDVATNHNIMYAYSPDEGETWLNSDDQTYNLPITYDQAEPVFDIPQGSELINQTSMAVNSSGEPVIATYWRSEENSVPQFYIVWRDGGIWQAENVGERTLDFSLSGGGTKRIPISRPQILAGSEGDLYVIFRDFERSGGISVAISDTDDYKTWRVKDIYRSSVGLWEPTLDFRAWEEHQEIHLLVQRVGQGDHEGMEEIEPQPVNILEWTPSLYHKSD